MSVKIGKVRTTKKSSLSLNLNLYLGKLLHKNELSVVTAWVKLTVQLSYIFKILLNTFGFDFKNKIYKNVFLLFVWMIINVKNIE